MTTEGFEETMGVNHLGTFLLTRLLLDRLLATRGSRVVVVTGEIYSYGGPIDFDHDFAVTTNDPNYSGLRTYQHR